MLNQKMLHELFTYDNGNLFWKVDRNCNLRGKLAGSIDREYRRVKIGRTSYRINRLVWEYHHGLKPSGVVDHINRDKLDNRIENLQDISVAENMKNKKSYKNGRHPYPGIYRNDYGRWRAQIRVERKLISIGTYESFEEAISARLTAEDFYDFSDIHCKPGGLDDERYGR